MESARSQFSVFSEVLSTAQQIVHFDMDPTEEKSLPPAQPINAAQLSSLSSSSLRGVKELVGEPVQPTQLLAAVEQCLQRFGSVHLLVSVQAPSQSSQSSQPMGYYGRLLSSQNSSSPSSSFYSPEGSEYSIYYGGQYLYLTPDLFTGLMTALFFLLVFLVGLGRLSAIQGMSTFYDRLPAVGKEN